MNPLGVVIAISSVCIAFHQYLQNPFHLEICIRHYSILKRKKGAATIDVAWVK